MNTKNKKILAWALMILWMGIIFLMSHQPGEVSSKQSNFVIWLFNVCGINLDSYFGNLASFIVRKGAHFTEYMILCFFVTNLIKHYYPKNNKIYIYAIIVVFLYACSDEVHQLFVPGRDGRFKDVLIDTSGGIFGIIIVYIKNVIKKHS